MAKSLFFKKKKNFADIIIFLNIELAYLGYPKKIIPHMVGTIRQYKVIIVMRHCSLIPPWRFLKLNNLLQWWISQNFSTFLTALNILRQHKHIPLLIYSFKWPVLFWMLVNHLYLLSLPSHLNSVDLLGPSP